MSVNITENKFSSSTDISVGDYDKITEGKMMYDNIDVKFPVKKIPVNNEMFSKKKQASIKHNKAKKSKAPLSKAKKWRSSKRLATRKKAQEK
tara:strand:- start:329 stop:604 length:276 start_codon:yes stop_codon:yes gene_type:complete